MNRPNRRQQRRRRQRRATLAPPPPPPPPPAEPSLGRITLGALVWLAGSVAYFLLFAVRETTARGWVDGARSLTGGDARGMAIAGWVTIFAAFGLAWALMLMRKRVHRGWLYAIGAAAVAVSPTALTLFPMEGFPIVHLISGPGGGAFVHGMRLAAPAVLVTLLLAPFALVKEEARGPVTMITGLCVFLALVAAPLTT
ncbi:hypothetical protein Q0Z83_080760 [Actinoplanes sichuanensis]|uniref:DUF998 domain-containing protein n=1 Tax=Actinoplanes sichuanensis TaxID=512349 RepID=A0ABW4AEH0_9ACTN|nr:hypothetical protein [Actinoplanes sichuanensis]BEL09885.1 hypothetical protein Q0Z83_080760 [Actinoplanes sichuanensis]